MTEVITDPSILVTPNFPPQPASYRLAAMLREKAADEDIIAFARASAHELGVSVRCLLVEAAAILMHQLNQPGEPS